MTNKVLKLFSHPWLFLFVSFLLFLSRLLFSFCFTSSSSLYFLQLNTINYDLHLCIIQKLYLHLSRSTLLRKTLTVNYYLGIEYFQHPGFLEKPPVPVGVRTAEKTASNTIYVCRLKIKGIWRALIIKCSPWSYLSLYPRRISKHSVHSVAPYVEHEQERPTASVSSRWWHVAHR